MPDDFRFIVDGKPLSVHDLKPGMKGAQPQLGPILANRLR